MTQKLSAVQSQMGVIVAAAAVARAMLTWFGGVAAAVAAAMGVVASLMVVAETAGCSCSLPNNPATHFDGKNTCALLTAAAEVAAEVAAAGSSIV